MTLGQVLSKRSGCPAGWAEGAVSVCRPTQPLALARPCQARTGPTTAQALRTIKGSVCPSHRGEPGTRGSQCTLAGVGHGPASAFCPAVSLWTRHSEVADAFPLQSPRPTPTRNPEPHRPGRDGRAAGAGRGRAAGSHGEAQSRLTSGRPAALTALWLPPKTWPRFSAPSSWRRRRPWSRRRRRIPRASERAPRPPPPPVESHRAGGRARPQGRARSRAQAPHGRAGRSARPVPSPAECAAGQGATPPPRDARPGQGPPWLRPRMTSWAGQRRPRPEASRGPSVGGPRASRPKTRSVSPSSNPST